jgi:hypothetical protein
MALQMTPASTDAPWEAFQQEIDNEHEQTTRSLKEATLMLEQSQRSLRGSRSGGIAVVRKPGEPADITMLCCA